MTQKKSSLNKSDPEKTPLPRPSCSLMKLGSHNLDAFVPTPWKDE